jgi:hypothetical protein
MQSLTLFLFVLGSILVLLGHQLNGIKGSGIGFMILFLAFLCLMCEIFGANNGPEALEY